MDTKNVIPIEKAKRCLDERKSFVMQGGAGSGKTETLKDLLQYLMIQNPSAKIACITHTNSAVEEIKVRTKSSNSISTIHSFMYSLIKDYKKNIKSVISELFVLPLVEPDMQSVLESENERKKIEYEKYKKIYEKYADKIYSLDRTISGKVVGKKDYDKNVYLYNSQLNIKISELNTRIIDIIQKSDYLKIYYNETKFDRFQDLSFGHDGLLTIAHKLLEKFTTLKKIICDRFDYIFLDEYQDARAELVDDLFKISKDSNLTICLFGDSMQSIYNKGIGDIGNYVKSDCLTIIPKSDNYRCSFEVIEIINKLRLDDIVQEVAFAMNKNGEYETEYDRHGSVKVIYTCVDSKPTSFSVQEEKDTYLSKVDRLISIAEDILPDAKILLLTNKAIAEKEGFPNLYKVFNDRYVEVNDYIDDYFKKNQISDLCELCNNYELGVYNPIIKATNQSGYAIIKVKDKIELIQIFSDLTSKDLSLKAALDLAFSKRIMNESETRNHILTSNERYLQSIYTDELYQQFKEKYLTGMNTYIKMIDAHIVSSQEEFDDYKGKLSKEKFINKLSSDEIKFSEVLRYYKYINEQSKYVTMHKTKGTSIDSVIVVLEEYFWTNEYDFKLLYLDSSIRNKKRDNSQKLVYVACSRARKNLLCIKIVTPEEESDFCRQFPLSNKLMLE